MADSENLPYNNNDNINIHNDANKLLKHILNKTFELNFCKKRQL